MQLTDSQRKAVYSEDKNILVSAGAGSGKTSVLAGRIARLIAQGLVEADEIIAVTFTKSAAAKLKSRIRRQLMQSENDASSVKISEQLAKLELAPICTIDSLCKRIIERFYHIIGADPSFSVIGSAQESLMMMERACEKLYEELLEENDEEFQRLEDLYSFGYESSLTQTIINIYLHIQNKCEPIEWLKQKAEEFKKSAENFDDSRVFEILKKHLEIYASDIKICAQEGLRLTRSDYKCAACFSSMAELSDAIVSSLASSASSFFETIRAVSKFPRFTVPKSHPDYMRLKLLHKKAKGAFTRLKEIAAFSYEKNLEFIFLTAKSVCKIVEIVERFSDIYSNIKKSMRLADFSDLAHECLAILNSEQVLKQLSSEYKYIFIDEYQDTNSLQEAIITRLAATNSLFAVGDIKQSIYRFRNAEPEIFLKKQRECEKGKGLLVRMRENFRSSPVIVEAVNTVFSRIMTKDKSGIDYASDESMTSLSTLNSANAAQLHIILSGDSDSHSRIAAEAEYVASLVKNLIGKNIYDEETHLTRPLRPEDIAVIGRRMNSISSYYTQAFKNAGIDFACIEQEEYFDAMEIALMINLLKIIDNFMDDIALISVMRSFIFGFNEDELLKIRAHYTFAHYYDAVKKYAKDGPDDNLRLKTSYMINEIKRYRHYSRVSSIEDLIMKIYADTNLTMYVSALKDGEKRSQNLNELAQRAASFEQTQSRGLYSFIKYLEKLKEKAERGASKAFAGEGKVSLVTVHAAKGLEYEAVIVVDTALNIIEKSPFESIYCHKDVGICPVFVSEDASYRCDTIYRLTASAANRAENREEEARILYVAATRAKQMLYFTGCITEKAYEEMKAYPPDMTPSLTESVSFLKWLYFAIVPDKRSLDESGSYETRLWKIKTVTHTEAAEESAETVPDKYPADEAAVKQIKSRIGYTYPHKNDEGIPTKVTVSELKESMTLEYGKKLISMREDIVFDKDQALTPAAAGSALHKFMQHLDEKSLDKNDLLSSIDKQKNILISNGVLIEKEAEAVNSDAVVQFFSSDIGHALLNADQIKKETAFIMQIKPARLDSRWQKSKRDVILQGVIDCYFVYKGETYLIDYKTDKYISEERKKESDEKYSLQIRLYAEALSKIKGRNPDKCFIVYLEQNRTVEVGL